MKSKLVFLQNQLKSILKSSLRTKNRKYTTTVCPPTPDTAVCDAHMDEMPVPCGPWDVYYKQKNTVYNAVLTLGLLWLAFSFFMFKYTECMFFNFFPPDRPAPPVEVVDKKDICVVVK